MRQARSTVEGAFLAALTVIFYLSSIYIPVLGFLLSFLCPLPIMFLTIRWDMKAGLLAALVASFYSFYLCRSHICFNLFCRVYFFGINYGSYHQKRL